MFHLPWESTRRTEARRSGLRPEKALLWRIAPSLLLLLNAAGGEGGMETCEEKHVFTSVRTAPHGGRVTCCF